jgi:cytochrome c-type biogenesis protein CcmH
MKRACAALITCLALVAAAHAADTPVTFANDVDRARYERLLEELRCLVCQNQSLADSHAELAQDLRDEVYAMIADGKDDAAITAFMVARYGDFVLYKPPVKSSTWLLWFGPGVLVIIAVVIVALTARSSKRRATPLSAAERAQAQALLDEHRTPGG